MENRRVFSGIRFDVHEIQIPLGDGDSVTRHVVRHPGAVVIAPLLDDQHVVMIRNARATVGETLWELPAGTCEAGESIEITAGRELIEETGYRAGRLTEAISFFASPGITDERMHLFVAEKLSAGPPAREPGEQIENHVLSWQQIDELIDRGEIHDGKTLCSLLWVRRWLSKRQIS